MHRVRVRAISAEYAHPDGTTPERISSPYTQPSGAWGERSKMGLLWWWGGYVRVWATGGFWDALITIPQAQARADERITVQIAGQSDPGS